MPAPTIYSEQENENRTILVVDDDFGTREALRLRIEHLGYRGIALGDGRQALEALKEQNYDLVLLDVMMPEMDGYEVLHQIKSDEALRNIPVIMVSALDEMESVVRCIEAGAEDYLPKPFDPTLLKARVGACLEKKALRDLEQKHLATIEATQKRLSQELAEAANYVKSILPSSLQSPLKTDWRYIPSTELGGDSFGYHWIDDEHFAIYLLDVCGHGVGASLLSVSAINVIRTGSLVGTDFRDPGAVLTGLNEAFPMERQNDMYFTVWYGVYHRPSRTLRHSSGGHPPAILATTADSGSIELTELRCPGPLIGVVPDTDYLSEELIIPANSHLFVFCDGVFEIENPADQKMIDYRDFFQLLQSIGTQEDSLDLIESWAKKLNGKPHFDDDFSIVRLDLP